MSIKIFASLAAVSLALGCSGSTDAPDVSVFDYDQSQPLDVHVAGFTGSSTTYINQITFVSPAGGLVTGMVAEPKMFTGQLPGIVMVHDFPPAGAQLPGAIGALTRDGGHELATRGAIVICIDAPWLRRGGLPDFTVRDSIEQVQLIQELRRAIDYLASRPDVDPARLGYLGQGYGGAIGELLAGVDHRLKAVALRAPDGGLVARYTDAQGKPSGPLAARPTDAQERWLAAMRPIEPIRYLGMAPPAVVFIQSARQDSVVPTTDADEVHAAARQPRSIFWYDGGHSLQGQAKAELLTWFADQLGTAP